MEQKPFEPIPKVRPGDEVLRRRREPRRRLRLAPNVPGIIRVLGDMVTRTPFVPMLSIVIALWLFFSAGFYFAENGVNEHVHSYGQALWWGLAAVETMGTPFKPLTTAGHIIGGIWAVVGVMTFWGMIIATVTSYFMTPRRRPIKAVTSTVQYNLEVLEDLSLEELETLKDVTDGLINAQIGKVKKQPPQG